MCRTATYTRLLTREDVASIEHPKHEVLAPHDEVGNYATFATGTRAQLAHTHHITDLTASGQGACHGCGLSMWSGAWVAKTHFGEARQEYMKARILAWVDLANRDAAYFAALHDNTPVALRDTVRPAIAAMLDPDEPAMLVGKRESVPAMKRGVLA